jgi:hypothetical protein
MNKLVKKLFTPFALFALALGVGMTISQPKALVGAKAATEAVAYTTGFENEEGFTASTTYNNATLAYTGPTDQQWGTIFGTPSTTGAISGGQSMQMRAYKDNTTMGYTEMNFDIAAMTKVNFKALSTGGLSVKVSYSTDSGTTYVGEQTFTLTPTATEYTYNVSATGEYAQVRLKFQLYFASTPTATNRVTLDDIAIYSMQYNVVLLDSISVSGTPTKTSYFDGETFDATGLTVTAHYSNSTQANVTASTTYSPAPLTTGTTTVTASYTELGVTKTAEITGITVTAIVTTGISIETQAPQSFTLGSAFNTNGLTLRVTKNNGTSEVISTGFTVTGVNTMVLGAQTASVSYGDFTVTYPVTVTNNGANVGDVVLATDLFISEYVEGGSNNKAFEIFNGTGSNVDLTVYKAQLFANGASTPTNTLELKGELLNGQVISIVNSSATAAFKVGNFITHAVANYNGDDAIVLLKNDVIIDVIGVVGTDPGSEWKDPDGDGSTLDKTLVRKQSVISPNTTFTWAEWDVYPMNTSSYLGSHEFASSDVTNLEQATAFANYVMTGLGHNANGNCEAVLSALQAEYNYMPAESKAEFEGNAGSLFVDARARLVYLQAWVSANGTPPGRPAFGANQNSILSIAIIGVISLSTLVGLYFVNKKRVRE